MAFSSVLIAEQYGASGVGLSAATVELEEIHGYSGNGGACHAQMCTIDTLLRHESDTQEDSRRACHLSADGRKRLPVAHRQR